MRINGSLVSPKVRTENGYILKILDHNNYGK